MPLYEYQCRQCGHRFEKIQSFSAPEEKQCPECQGEVQRLISAPAIQFKGAGWYVNDYAPKSPAKAGTKAEAATSSDGSGKTQSDGAAPSTPKPAEAVAPPSTTSGDKNQ